MGARFHLADGLFGNGRAKTPETMLLRLQNSFASMTRLGQEQERTANNLANASTVGFKRDRTFVAAFNERLDNEGAPQTDRVTTQWADMEMGTFESTGNPLDVALRSEGFFVVADENGAERYTRAGRMTPDADGVLRDPTGRIMMGENGPLTLPPAGGAVTISPNGDVRSGDQFIGKLRVVGFEDPMQLVRADGATFTAPNQQALDLDEPNVMQGYVESSNVNVISAMTEMIQHFRLFETQQKMLQTTDQVLAGVTRDLGRF